MAAQTMPQLEMAAKPESQLKMAAKPEPQHNMADMPVPSCHRWYKSCVLETIQWDDSAVASFKAGSNMAPCFASFALS
ncbi:hypothetical protein Baya_6176 [Bagarius yarrelli]|uniref:Uncharacterized protein n=1 Tax=Bagarius yarrelli TaxID=175774 RepID=A0A556U582_BAGYA|nr:hypothetical protein Baya_6176 [Bagarius yarrelli]